MTEFAGGAVRFDEFMDGALYGPSGFYVRGGHPGRREGDFATSVELGSLFARCIVRYLDQVWHELGRPSPFVVVEGGAGRGTLCRDVLAHVEACRDSLRYVMVERVERQRTEALERVAALGAEVPVVAVADLPAGPLTGVVLANELLDNLPFRLLERSGSGWQEVWVTESAEELRSAPQDAAAMAEALVPGAVQDTRIPLQLKASVWVRRALGVLDRGRLLLFDYGSPTTAELAARPATEWLRTYRSQRRGDDPLRDPGSTDITCDVVFDQLPPGAALTRQADWLRAAGIDALTAEAQTLWKGSRASPTADALAARTLVDEAAALTDPEGMGAFWVAEWRAG